MLVLYFVEQSKLSINTFKIIFFAAGKNQSAVLQNPTDKVGRRRTNDTDDNFFNFTRKGFRGKEEQAICLAFFHRSC